MTSCWFVTERTREIACARLWRPNRECLIQFLVGLYSELAGDLMHSGWLVDCNDNWRIPQQRHSPDPGQPECHSACTLFSAAWACSSASTRPACRPAWNRELGRDQNIRNGGHSAPRGALGDRHMMKIIKEIYQYMHQKPVTKRMLNRTLLPIRLPFSSCWPCFSWHPAPAPEQSFQGNVGLSARETGNPSGLTLHPPGNAPQFFQAQATGHRARAFPVKTAQMRPTGNSSLGSGFLSAGVDDYLFRCPGVSLAAQLGMFLAKRWGQILGFSWPFSICCRCGFPAPDPAVSAFALRNPFTLILALYTWCWQSQ